MGTHLQLEASPRVEGAVPDGFTFEENPALAGIEPRLPAGFDFLGGHCGIKRRRLDLALLRVTASEGAALAACYTQSAVRAACVRRGAKLSPRAGVRAVLINSGNANAMTGAQGEADDAQLAASVAAQLGCEASAVFTNSTGVIGVPLPLTRICGRLPELCAEGASEAGAEAFANAILTTDTCTKTVLAELSLSQGRVRIFGVAKGSGMVHPNMATTLAYLCTDARVDPALLQGMLSEHIVRSFNAITVDGDTSTNDSVLALASGSSGVPVELAQDRARFGEALRTLLCALAKQVARDGEGATRLLEVEVKGAPSQASAHHVARTIAASSLFKCSVFAGEAEWGRLVAALGQAASEAKLALDPAGLQVFAQGVQLVRAGLPCNLDAQENQALTRALKGSESKWTVELGLGGEAFTAWGCDLSYDYVRINADEASQIQVRPDGRVGRNLSLQSYTPKLKHQLLVDGLGYVRRFAGMRVALLATGAVLHRPMLFASWARDLELLIDAGMRPLLILVDADAERVAERLDEALEGGLFRLARVRAEVGAIQPRLDRGQPCLLVAPELSAAHACNLAAQLGVGKLICLDDDAGLHFRGGALIEQLEPDAAARELAAGELACASDWFAALVHEGQRHALPALHLIDGRLPHALVAELFTDRGVGTLVSHQQCASPTA